ncbi:pitrilysin family protein [Flavobacterium sp. ASW18X]|uniref:M16 family metallopeptidase n=1 Tax=Flavobacterium sp. ASW18X TaxID=2572595 RepID=UPI0010AEAD30|nr:M16 family metallopeptidase [Flavobacterium sp. ASW18X]TKD66120.1 insulinase family protein [Flavobacterium sp. ASW18X]
MKKTFFFGMLVLLLVFQSCKKNIDKQGFAEVQQTDINGFTYTTVSNDPTGTRIYKLENGLTVYLSKNTAEPKIQTFVPVRAGSVYDPKDNTGLAHYLEHMMFKGTSKFGTSDWETEKILLDSISNLYELHKAESDEEKKKEIYKQIDQVSYEASTVSIANEYDKMVASYGAQGTNAWTWHEETVYTNKIPSNALEKWLTLESERFGELVLRIFHTELEAVYEEFNRSQDNDFRRASYAMNDALFPKHPYGQQTTIGTSEHLKNPSMVAIRDYYNKYYVPNNMAVILVGDLDFEKTIQMVNETFGKMEYKEVTHPERPTEDPLTTVVEREVFGPETERLNIAFRTPAMGTEDEIKIKIIDMILSNSTAGLIDLNLNKAQKVQQSGSYTQFLNDYGMHVFYGSPKSGQTLEEVKDLLLGQIEEVKKGNFDDWLTNAVVNDLKLQKMKNYEDASNVAYDLVESFVHFQDWKDRVALLDKMKKVSKEELVAFANEFYKDNYVVVYKRQGEPSNVVKVENPGITPVELNRDKKSDFFVQLDSVQMPKLEPVFIDYEKAITNSEVNNVPLSYVANERNDLMELNLIFDMGSEHNKQLPIALNYLEYLGTDQMSAEDISKEFYKLGVDYGVRTRGEQTVIYLSGLRENLSEGLRLLEDLWANAVPNQEAYDKYVLKIAKSREETKANKGAILWNGLFSYGQYGENSPTRDIYTINELKQMQPQTLVDLIKGLKEYKHRFFYYGKDIEEAKTAIAAYHKITDLKPYPAKKEYSKQDTGDNVFFTNYDMVQAEMVFLGKGNTFDANQMAKAQVFNSYFGSGLSSIVFQEIRESQSLAYAAFSAHSLASKKGEPNYTYAYIGTQANKLNQAVDAMLDLMTEMPEVQANFDAAKEATLNKMAAERVLDKDIFWNYESLKKRGIRENNAKAIYDEVAQMELNDLATFFTDNIAETDYTLLVVGNKNDLDVKALEKLGKVKELDVDYLFNYETPPPIKD